MTSKLHRALGLAMAAAQESSVYFRHGAVLFHNRQYYKAAPNQYRTVNWAWRHKRNQRCLEEMRRNNMHAEVACCHNVSRDVIQNSDIFVVRLNHQDRLMNSKPCENCQYNMRTLGIKKCYFSMDPNTIGVIHF